jgi:hypothetical protein
MALPNISLKRTRREASSVYASIPAARRLASPLAVMSHTHKFACAEWPFGEEPNVVAVTTVHVLESQLPIVLVTHDADDGMWQILCGTTNDPKDGRVVCLGCMFESDPSIGELADLPLGWRATRDGPGEPWHRERSGDGSE